MQECCKFQCWQASCGYVMKPQCQWILNKDYQLCMRQTPVREQQNSRELWHDPGDILQMRFIRSSSSFSPNVANSIVHDVHSITFQVCLISNGPPLAGSKGFPQEQLNKDIIHKSQNYSLGIKDGLTSLINERFSSSLNSSNFIVAASVCNFLFFPLKSKTGPPFRVKRFCTSQLDVYNFHYFML